MHPPAPKPPTLVPDPGTQLPSHTSTLVPGTGTQVPGYPALVPLTHAAHLVVRVSRSAVEMYSDMRFSISATRIQARPCKAAPTGALSMETPPSATQCHQQLPPGLQEGMRMG